MDAIKFIRERKRMCDYYKGCEGCPLEGESSFVLLSTAAERLVEVVDSWSAAHPRKTRQDIFLGAIP
jgi:hypothetical protein